MSQLDEPREIDWSTAVVEDGRLSVELTGEASRSWSEHMQGVLVRLDARRAGAIKVARRRIRAPDVDADSADELRHLLESAVRQTNADLVAEQPEDPAGGADQELTEAFRAFGAGSS